MQTVVVGLLAVYALPETGPKVGLLNIPLSLFAAAAVLSLASHWVGFMISVAIKSDKWFDVTEDVAYLAIFAWCYASCNASGSAPTGRQQLVFAMVSVRESNIRVGACPIVCSTGSAAPAC